MKWSNLFWWVFQRGLFGGMILGGLYGTLYLPLLGTLYGLFFGAVVGLIVGIVDGLALTLLTRIWFAAAQDLLIYRLSSVTIAILFTVDTSLVTFNKLFPSSPNFVFPPTVIAACAALYFAWRFPRYAVTQLALRNTPSKFLSHIEN